MRHQYRTALIPLEGHRDPEAAPRVVQVVRRNARAAPDYAEVAPDVIPWRGLAHVWPLEDHENINLPLGGAELQLGEQIQCLR